MRRLFVIVALFFVFAGLTNSAHAVGINQQWGFGSALPDGLRDNSIERQREEIARNMYNNTRPAGPGFQSRVGDVGRSYFPGALGFFESVGRAADSSRKWTILPRTILEGEGEFTGSADLHNPNIKLQGRIYPGWGRQ